MRCRKTTTCVASSISLEVLLKFVQTNESCGTTTSHGRSHNGTRSARPVHRTTLGVMISTWGQGQFVVQLSRQRIRLEKSLGAAICGSRHHRFGLSMFVRWFVPSQLLSKIPSVQRSYRDAATDATCESPSYGSCDKMAILAQPISCSNVRGVFPFTSFSGCVLSKCLQPSFVVSHLFSWQVLMMVPMFLSLLCLVPLRIMVLLMVLALISTEWVIVHLMHNSLSSEICCYHSLVDSQNSTIKSRPFVMPLVWSPSKKCESPSCRVGLRHKGVVRFTDASRDNEHASMSAATQQYESIAIEAAETPPRLELSPDGHEPRPR